MAIVALIFGIWLIISMSGNSSSSIKRLRESVEIFADMSELSNATFFLNFLMFWLHTELVLTY